MGLTGALGAIPGTLCSHPLDVLKIRMQTSSAGSYFAALNFALDGGTSGASSVRGLYRGLLPAVEQRVLGRGPLFLFTELCTQLVEANTTWSAYSTRFVGSAAAGYMTGALAGISEYRKKLISQAVLPATEATWAAIVQNSLAAGQRASLLRRLHAAGICSASYACVFFSTERYLSKQFSWSAPISYGCAAACGIVVAWLPDVAVARMMVVPPSGAVPGVLASTAAIVREPMQGHTGGRLEMVYRCIRGSYRGLVARGLEFVISYSVTGLVFVGTGAVSAALVNQSWSTAVDPAAPVEDKSL